METEWDEAKRLANIAKHGLDFADVTKFGWDSAAIIEDTRYDYPERRYWAIGTLNQRLHVVTFCIRGAKIRLISFRKANGREIKRHGHENS